VDTESIGNVLCKKADELNAAAIIVSLHSKSRLQEFVLGSITSFCTCGPLSLASLSELSAFSSKAVAAACL
jgi:hypothetical protein